MLKNVLTILSVLLVNVTFAQNKLPNPNFELWTISSDNKDSLVGWSSSDAVAINPVKPLNKDTSSFQGDYAVKLITAPFGIVQYSKVGMLVNGQALFDWNGGSGYSVEYVSGGGTPISIKPTELKGYYKCEVLSPSSEGFAEVLLTKYNTALHKRDTVSYTSYNFLEQTNYTAFLIPLPDLMPGTMPDSISTFFYSSNPATVPQNNAWSTLYLDSLTLTDPNPIPAPVAAFTANPTMGTTDSIINITDNSTNSPSAWKWHFIPDNVIFEQGTSDTSQNPVVKFNTSGDYSVQLIVGNYSGSDSISKANYIHIADSGVGIANNNTTKVLPAIYPNPSKDKIYINPAYFGATIQVTDIYGRVVLQLEKSTAENIDISQLNAGIYIIRLTKGSQFRTQKMLIQK